MKRGSLRSDKIESFFFLISMIGIASCGQVGTSEQVNEISFLVAYRDYDRDFPHSSSLRGDEPIRLCISCIGTCRSCLPLTEQGSPFRSRIKNNLEIKANAQKKNGLTIDDTLFSKSSLYSIRYTLLSTLYSLLRFIVRRINEGKNNSSFYDNHVRRFDGARGRLKVKYPLILSLSSLSLDPGSSIDTYLIHHPHPKTPDPLCMCSVMPYNK